MATEIERKFLVNAELLKHIRPETPKKYIRQGFLSSQKERVVRVRITNDKALLTIKGLTEDNTKPEFEYEIPMKDAEFMLDNLCEPGQIEKTRYLIPYRGATALRMEVTEDSALTWEVDEFYGDNKGLTVAEIELASAEQEIYLPEWVTTEVSDDPRYFNSNLIKLPFKNW